MKRPRDLFKNSDRFCSLYGGVFLGGKSLGMAQRFGITAQSDTLSVSTVWLEFSTSITATRRKNFRHGRILSPWKGYGRLMPTQSVSSLTISPLSTQLMAFMNGWNMATSWSTKPGYNNDCSDTTKILTFSFPSRVSGKSPFPHPPWTVLHVNLLIRNDYQRKFFRILDILFALARGRLYHISRFILQSKLSLGGHYWQWGTCFFSISNEVYFRLVIHCFTWRLWRNGSLILVWRSGPFFFVTLSWAPMYITTSICFYISFRYESRENLCTCPSTDHELAKSPWKRKYGLQNNGWNKPRTLLVYAHFYPLRNFHHRTSVEVFWRSWGDERQKIDSWETVTAKRRHKHLLCISNIHTTLPRNDKGAWQGATALVRKVWGKSELIR